MKAARRADAVGNAHTEGFGDPFAAKTYGHLRDEHSATMALRMTFDANAEA